MLSGLAEEAKAQSDDNTWRFLTLLAEEQQQDGLLLQSVLEEIRNADKAGLGMEQTDRRLMASSEKHRSALISLFALSGERVALPRPVY
jgi:ferritin